MATIFDRLVLAKIESTKGTDPTPAPATDAVRVRSVTVSKAQDNLDRAVVKQSMGMLPHLVGKESMTCTLEVELRGSGAAGTAPEWGPLLQACRTTETIVPATSVTYAPSTGTEKSCTIYVYKDGLLWKFIGAVGTVSISNDIGQIGIATFTMSAPYLAPTAVADPAGAVYDNVQPIVTSSSTVINDGASIKVSTWALDLAGDVQEHYVTGDHQFVVADRPAATCTFTKDSVATAAEWTALSSGTDAALSFTLGATAGNICTITAPVARRDSVAYGERAERDTLDVAYRLYESTTDDAFSIALT